MKEKIWNYLFIGLIGLGTIIVICIIVESIVRCK